MNKFLRFQKAMLREADKGDGGNSNPNPNPQPQETQGDDVANLLKSALNKINEQDATIKSLNDKITELSKTKEETKPQEQNKDNYENIISQLAQRLSINTSSKGEQKNDKPQNRSLSDIMNLYN